MKQYRGERVLRAAKARLVPPDIYLEDCICRLLLTQSYFYALEDMFNGNFEERLVIPLSRIREMEMVVYQKTMTKMKGSEGRLAVASVFVNAILAEITGIDVMSGPVSRSAPSRYLEIIHIDRNGRNARLYFNECASVKPLIKAFRKRQKELYNQ